MWKPGLTCGFSSEVVPGFVLWHPGWQRGRRRSTLLRELPRVQRAVLDGVLSQEQAAVLSRLVGEIPAEQLAEVEPQLVEVATGRDPVALGWWVRDLSATHCEPQLDAEGDADSRTAGQRRAGALVELAERSLRRDSDLGVHGGSRPQVSDVLPADWAARQAGRATCAVCSRWPEHRPASFADTVLASRAGADGVPAEHACAVGAWTGPTTRTRVEAVLCDAHHLTHRADGGRDELADLVLLCRRHHVLWHLGRTALAEMHVPWLTPQQSGAGPPAA